MKRILVTLLLCTALASQLGAAERLHPGFFIDTETAAYLPVGLGFSNSSMIETGLFGLSQDLTIVDPMSTLGIGVRTALEHSPAFDTLTLPVQAVVSAGYNLKLGGGLTFFLDPPNSETGTTPEHAVLSGIMTFTWPMAEIGPSYLGLLFGTQLFYWSSTDTWGYTSSNFELTMSIGASLRFDPLDHPANRTLYPEYTRSYDY